MKGNWGPTTTHTVDLDYEQLLVMQAQPGTRLRVMYGDLWLTEEGELIDRFAASGEEITLVRPGRTVVEALGLARVQILQPIRTSFGRSFWRALLARLHLRTA